MTRRLRFTSIARRDVHSIAVEIGQHNRAAARRFRVAVETKCKNCAGNPTMGNDCRLYNPRLKGVRVSSVPGFENYLIFSGRLNPECVSCACCTVRRIGRAGSISDRND